MTKPVRRLISLTTKEQNILCNEEIIEEGMKWVRRNKGCKLDPESGNYTSPRISSEVMDCSMPMTFDHFNFCSLGCTYCFAYFFKSNNPATQHLGLRSVNVNHMINALTGNPSEARGRLMYDHFYSKKFLLHWGGLADPFCNFERSNTIGYELIDTLGQLNYPTLFSFKGNTILDDHYIELFQRYASQSNFAFQISMVTGDDNLAKQVEIGVPSPGARLRAIKILSDMGYWTILRLRPFIIGVTDLTLDTLLEQAYEAGIQGISTEFFALDARANVGMKKRYDWLSKLIGVDDLMGYFKDLSPSERGGYMRLNRLVKEAYIKKIYKFCIERNLTLGISDPDFKELCTSGSCCGMPDDFPRNRLLENWSRSQLTYHLKRLRQQYHRTGSAQNLHFNEVYDDEQSFLDEFGFKNDHVSVTSMCNAERYQQTYRIIIQRHWNNLKSPANPRNYFHGKLIPIGLDSESNLIYRYNPMEYEERWVSEGIDLTI